LRQHFQWSLRTQVIAALFVGYLFLLWHWRSPWILADESKRQELIQKYSDTYSKSVSPDGTRHVEVNAEDELCVSNRDGTVLWSARFDTLISPPPKFFCNEAFSMKFLPKFSDGLYHHRIEVFWRRHPEGWLGHFYRPEVWLLPLWLGLIVWTIRKGRLLSL